jgi:hypothetical protein
VTSISGLLIMQWRRDCFHISEYIGYSGKSKEHLCDKYVAISLRQSQFTHSISLCLQSWETNREHHGNIIHFNLRKYLSQLWKYGEHFSQICVDVAAQSTKQEQ